MQGGRPPTGSVPDIANRCNKVGERRRDGEHVFPSFVRIWRGTLRGIFKFEKSFAGVLGSVVVTPPLTLPLVLTLLVVGATVCYLYDYHERGRQ